MDTVTDHQREELRDQFAIAALTALLSHIPPSAAFATRVDKHTQDEAHEKLAHEAYRWADAMLKARTEE